MKCKEFVDKICDYLDDKLIESERAEFDACLESDPCCQHYFAAYQTAIRLGKSVCECPETSRTKEPLPDDMVSSIVESAKRKGQS